MYDIRYIGTIWYKIVFIRYGKTFTIISIVFSYKIIEI